MSHVPGDNVRSAISLSQILHRVIASGKITRADEVYFFRAMSSESSLSSEDMKMLTMLMKRLDMGLVKVVPD